MPFPRCELCGAFLVCQTDTFQMVKGHDGKMRPGYGKMSYIHDGPCIPPVANSGRVVVTTIEKDCIECGEPFEADVDSPATEICGPDCRKVRETRKSKERYENRRTAAGWPPVRKAPLAQRFPEMYGRGAA